MPISIPASGKISKEESDIITQANEIEAREQLKFNKLRLKNLVNEGDDK